MPRIHFDCVDSPLGHLYVSPIKITFPALKSKSAVLVVAIGMVFGSAALATGAMNTPEDGYNFCVNNTTKVVSFPAARKCPKGSTLINFGAQGVAGAKGDTGVAGPQGAKGDAGLIGLTGLSGVNGSSLLGGVGIPNNSLGNNGDMYIDKNGAVIYGPKSTGLWGYGTVFGGPAGATGPAGPAGATGAAGAAGTGPVYLKTVDIAALTTTPTAVAQLSLPIGSYMTTFSALASANSGGVVYASCRIADTGTGSSQTIKVDSNSYDRAWITRIKVLTLDAPATVSAYCYQAFGVSTVIDVFDITFTAVQVSSVNTQ
jgi:hypothetical protein